MPKQSSLYHGDFLFRFFYRAHAICVMQKVRVGFCEPAIRGSNPQGKPDQLPLLFVHVQQLSTPLRKAKALTCSERSGVAP